MIEIGPNLTNAIYAIVFEITVIVWIIVWERRK